MLSQSRLMDLVNATDFFPAYNSCNFKEMKTVPKLAGDHKP